MSGNIHDTNTHRIKQDATKLLEEVRNIILQGNDPLDHRDRLETNYKYLSKTSNTLFTFILKSKNTDKEFVVNTLNMMLEKIKHIQLSQTTQYDASRDIGTHLAKQFIPQCKDIN
jgi:hypothetical protein